MEPPVDQPLFTYQRSLDQQLQALRDKVTERKDQIEVLTETERDLCQQLDAPVKGLPGTASSSNRLPSAEELEHFEFYLREMQALLDSRSEEMANIRFQVQSIADEIELDVSRSHLMAHQLKLSAANLDELRALLDNVRADKKNIKSEIQDKWTVLESLYECLDTSVRSRVDIDELPLTKVN